MQNTSIMLETTIKYTFLISLFLCCNISFSQSEIVRFRNINVSSGLSEGDVKVIYQDKKGFIWIGTKDGLNRFDGIEFKVYNYDALDSTSISDNFIYSIFEDSKGILWVGTNNGGLNRYNEDLESFTSFLNDEKNPKSISQNSVYSIAEDNDGNLWVGTKNKGLNLFNREEQNFTRYTYDKSKNEGIRPGSIWSMLKDKNGNLWISNNSGITKLIKDKNGKFIFKHIVFNELIDVSSIFEDNKGILWLSTWSNGLASFNPSTEKIVNHFKANKTEDGSSVNNKIIKGVVEDQSGKIWIATNGGGLNKYDRHKNEFTYYHNKPDNPFSLSSNNIWTIFKDKTGAIWLGLYAVGLDIFDLSNEHFHIYTKGKSKENNFSSNEIWSITGDNKNNIWVSTARGIDQIKLDQNREPAEIINFKNNSEQLGFINSFYLDKNENLWASGWGKGLFKYPVKHKGIDFESYSDPESKDSKKLNTSMVIYITGDSNGNIWVGSLSGLYKLNSENQEFKSYKNEAENPYSLSDNYVYYIMEDHSGKVWVGTNKGLNLLNKKNETFLRFVNKKNDPKSLSHNKINFIYEDKQNRIWVGTDGGGLNLFNNSTNNFTSYTTKNGLANNSIKGITSDDSGNLWITTNKGLSKFSVKENTFKNYTVDDGLQGKTFNRKSIYKDQNGFIYIGGSKGLNKFHPDSLKNNSYKPEIVITDFKLFNKSIKPNSELNQDVSLLTKSILNTKTIKLQYDQNVFSFKFSALSYHLPYKNQYAYIMEGLEKEWNYIGNRKEAYYTNVPHGKYIFRVKASNNDGIWNNEGVAIEIIITPPFWDTLLFKISIALLILGTGVLYYKMRMSSIKRINARLEIQVTERTAEVVAQKDEIKQQAEELQQQAEELEQQRDHLAGANVSITNKNDEISRMLDDIKVLSEIGQNVTATIDIDEIISRVYKSVNQLMDAPNFEIGIINEELNYVEYSGFRSLESNIFHASRKLFKTNSLTAYCVKNKKLVFITDIDKEISNYINDQKSIEKHINSKIKSLIYLPLHLENKIIGVLIVRSYSINAYSEIHLDILKNLGAYISIALDNAKAYNLIENKNQHITDSINAALSIQEAMLPGTKKIKQLLKDYFLIFKPKDIVSGDFYWLNKIDNKIFVGIVDCTGHGVPGAFMSMIGNSLLNRIIKEKKIFEPEKILEELDHEVKVSLSHDDQYSREGMDLGICVIEKNGQSDKKITYAGAKISLHYYDSNTKELSTIHATRRGIGTSSKNIAPFQGHQIVLQPNSLVFISTDGFIDQNNLSRKRFGSKKFLESVLKNSGFEMEKQGELLENELKSYQGDELQRDDITVLGFKI